MKTIVFASFLMLFGTGCLDSSSRKVGQVGGGTPQDVTSDASGIDVGADSSTDTLLPEPVCTTDADCDDGDDCTADLCNEKFCDHKPEPNGTDCTFGMAEGGKEMGVCAEGVCETFSCGTSSTCDDGDPCTQDFPDKSGCRNVPIDGCMLCDRDSDCTLPGLCVPDTAVEPVCTSERVCSFTYTYPDLEPYPYKNAVICRESTPAGSQSGSKPIKYRGTNGAPPTVCSIVSGGSNQMHIYALDGPPACWCIDSLGSAYRPTITYVSSPEERWVLKCCGSPPEIP